MAIKQITEITCDICGMKMPERNGVSIETGQPRPCAEADRPTHEIDLCHRCACEALQAEINGYDDTPKEKYGLVMKKIFSSVKRID
jgi:hypothetical protein